MNRNSKIVKMHNETQVAPQAPQAPQYPELFTDPEVADYGEVISTTEQGQVFVLKDDTVYLFQPVATRHFNHEEYYYNKVEFK